MVRIRNETVVKKSNAKLYTYVVTWCVCFVVYLPAFTGTAFLDILQELIVFGVTFTNCFYIDLLFISDVENDISMLLVLLDFLVGRFADI